MGVSISWLAVKGKAPELVLQEFGLLASSKMAGHGDTPLSARALPSGWFLVVIQGCDHKFIKPKSLASLSKNCEVIACSIEEHVMFSSAEQWTDGTRIWRAEHIGENGPIHLETSGRLPPSFQLIAEVQYELQEAGGGEKAEVDYYFDIPLNAAKNIVYFKHDDTGFGDRNFQALESAGKKSWWKFW